MPEITELLCNSKALPFWCKTFAIDQAPEGDLESKQT